MNPPEPLRKFPLDGDGPIFAEPWQAEAFALAVQLSATGHFEWSEWAGALGAELSRAPAEGDVDAAAHYYRCWLAALERMVISKNLLEEAALRERKAAWADAYRRTPHGHPVEL